ncbi:hypothetical protein JHK85_041275 [Glycine max]|nr:hypothetical protein JHK85_041275 [Glycine max]
MEQSANHHTEDVYAKHQTDLSHIMDQALALNILTMPRRSNTPPKVDYFEHYRYYHNRGHSTEECNAFEDKIEEFIKLDHLNDFFHKSQSYRLKGRNMPESNHGKD